MRALERHGHHAASVLIGEALAAAILGYDGCAADASRCHFTLQIDPFTSTPLAAPWAPKDGYGPMILALLEHAALRVGVVPRPPDPSMGPLRATASLLWSGAPTNFSATSGAAAAAAYSSNWTQVLGEHSYVLRARADTFDGARDGARLFACTAGVRVVTSLGGAVVGLVGIGSAPIDAELQVGGQTLRQRVAPNEEYAVDADAAGAMRAVLRRAAPFVRPFS